ncbi:MAG: alpha/beta hydrolase [Boseongicola sp.]|nr:alpha/beta hydrolase [Boseongicola sp.]
MPGFHAPDGARLHFADDGEGLPVLALSGLTRNGSDFDYLAPHLADSVRLIRMDYRGRGKSEWTGPETYTVPVETGDAIALLDHLGLDRVAVVGTSRGGLIAMVLAGVAKARLLGACLVDIGPEIAASGLETIRSYVGRNPTQETFAEAAEMRARLMEGFDDVPESRWEEEARRHYVESPGGLKINYDPALRDAFLSAAAAPAQDLWPMFDALAGLPVALVRGANSDILALEVAQEMCRRRPDMTFADVPGRGHVPFLDEPEALAAIREWIGRLP